MAKTWIDNSKVRIDNSIELSIRTFELSIPPVVTTLVVVMVVVVVTTLSHRLTTVDMHPGPGTLSCMSRGGVWVVISGHLQSRGGGWVVISGHLQSRLAVEVGARGLRQVL